MRIKPSDSKTSIVLAGSFNPLIFKPSWFAKNEIIGEEESENAEIEIIHSELVKFQLTWLSVVVEKSRFVAEVRQPPDIRLYDFVLKTFGEFLIHTPVWAMGINKRVEFDAGSFEQRNKIGHTLAPPQAWGEWSSKLDSINEKGSGGLVSITMRQSVADDREAGYIQTKVEPVKKSQSGVMVEVNDHYAVERLEDVEGCDYIVGMLRDNFDNSLSESCWIVDQVMGIIK